MDKPKKCTDCHGTGLLDEREQPPTPCPICFGSGVMPKVIKPIIDIYPNATKASEFYHEAYKRWASADNTTLFRNIGEFYANHAAKQIVEWLEKHYYGHLEKTFDETQLQSKIFVIPPDDWQSLKALIEK